MHNRQRFPREMPWGMTLVELLVVVAIMVILLAVSLPMLRPVFQSQRTANAARVLESTFQQARMKAIQERQPYGVRLLHFPNAPTASIEMRLQWGGAASFINPPDVRVRVEDGVIIPYRFQGGEWEGTNWGAVQQAREQFEGGGVIQFNHLGRLFAFSINESDDPALDSTDGVDYSELTLPEFWQDAMEYRITRSAETRLDWTPPIVMPQGTIIDLMFSGGETRKFNRDIKESGDGNIPYTFGAGDEVIVMFSPAGHVDRILVNNTPRPDPYNWLVNEMLYFCVGDWDRQVDEDRNPLAEDGKTNLEVPTTYWVTLHPKTGGVRVTENNPTPPNDTLQNQLHEARKFANEHFFNVGGN